MKRVAILTYDGLADLAPDDRLLLEAFATLGTRAEPLVWNRDAGKDFDAILIRSPWDYHLRPREFANWLDARERRGTRIFNDPAYVRWNIHKRYLHGLAARGLPVVETVFVQQGRWRDGMDEAACRGWGEWIVKPAVSATAHETRLIGCEQGLDNATLAWIRGLSERSDILIQPYLDEITSRGELSIVAIAGEVTHSILKRPAAGDFRVQTDFGGTVEEVRVTEDHRICARDFLTAAKELSQSNDWPAYARVDLVPISGGQWVLGELELVEPGLSLDMSTQATNRLAAFVHDRCS